MRKRLIAFALLLLSAAVPARADVIDQIGGSFSTFNPNGFVSAYSQFDTSLDSNSLGAFSQAYDNFTFGSNLSITQLDWVGIYDGDQFTTDSNGVPFGLLNPSLINPSFQVRIYADNANAPGTLLYSQSIAAGASSETQIGTPPQGTGPFAYSYSSAINGFAVNANQQYWVSVVGEMDYVQNGWGLALSSQGDLRSAQFFSPTTTIDTNFDYAVRITAVPEPSSGLALISVAGLAWVRRRKRVS